MASAMACRAAGLVLVVAALSAYIMVNSTPYLCAAANRYGVTSLNFIMSKSYLEKHTLSIGITEIIPSPEYPLNNE